MTLSIRLIYVCSSSNRAADGGVATRKVVTQGPVNLKAPGWRLRTQIHGRPVSQYELSTIDILRYQSEARMLTPSRIQHEAEEGAVLLDRYYDPCPNRKPLSQEDKFISLLSMLLVRRAV
jgi:hypothetical protein